VPDAIVISKVRKTFGSKVAVDDLDLSVPEGALYGLIGPNGAGKTTAIRMIMSILFPDSGQISVLGRRSASESKDRIGYLPEERGLYRKMRVGQFLIYAARLKGVDRAGLPVKVKTWLDRVGLGDCYRKRCEELSKGMQQKVQFISAVIHEPDLLILDEVFSGLDPINRRLLRSLIDEQHRAGRTVIFSTHAMFEAEQLCDHVLMIHRGAKVLDAPMREVLSRFDPRAVVVELLDAQDERSLASIPGVHEVGSSERGAFTVHFDEGLDASEAIRRIATAVPVRRVELKRPTLEDIFIELVERTGEKPPALEEIRAGSAADVES
jgi:ABC-2 type transport system ATP-binding protein